MKKRTKLWIKIIFFVLFVMAGSILMAAYEPSLSTDMALKQLNGTVADSQNLRAYELLKTWIPIGYLLTFLILFGKDLKEFIKLSMKSTGGRLNK